MMGRITDKKYIESLENGNQAQRACVILLNGELEAHHHRVWWTDQAIRILAGASYRELIDAWESLTGETWDVGIAP